MPHPTHFGSKNLQPLERACIHLTNTDSKTATSRIAHPPSRPTRFAAFLTQVLWNSRKLSKLVGQWVLTDIISLEITASTGNAENVVRTVYQLYEYTDFRAKLKKMWEVVCYHKSGHIILYYTPGNGLFVAPVTIINYKKVHVLSTASLPPPPPPPPPPPKKNQKNQEEHILRSS